MKSLSLRARLTLLISAALLIAWCIATSLTYLELRSSLRSIFDSQQLLFAKRLSVLNMHGQMQMRHRNAEMSLPEIRSPELKALDYDDDALAFAIFNRRGDMLLNDGEEGQKFQFDNSILIERTGVVVTETKKWRILWLLSRDKRSIIAVGQELEYQQELLEDLVYKQMKPWLFTFILLILFIVVMISREFAPLKKLTQKILQRAPDDESPIATEKTPKEIQPFIKALNALFARISQMIVRERQFTSDAAHELRTPLAALRVQTEVAQLSEDDPESQKHALNNLLIGIDRATHLVDQLLTLSRLDTFSLQNEVETVNWHTIAQNVIHELHPFAEQKAIKIQLIENVQTLIKGNPLLLSILLRNLVNNAIRYIPEDGQITITINKNQLTVEDNGDGVSEETLTRLGERFYRPAGQTVSGSGLGLSIVKQIAILHHFSVTFNNKSAGGFVVELTWQNNRLKK